MDQFNKCSFCNKVFDKATSKQRHEREVHLKPKVPCTKCDKMLSGSAFHRKRHEIKCLGVSSYTCSFCGELCSTLRQLNFHRKLKHGVKPPRAATSSATKQTPAITRPNRASTSDSMPSTSKETSTTSNQNASTRKQSNQPNDSNETVRHYQCRTCFQRFATNSALRNHHTSQHYQRGRGLQPTPYLEGQEPWLLHGDVIDQGLMECYQNNRPLILELPNPGPVESLFNVPVAENLSFEHIERSLNDIYETQTHAFRINLSFGFIMRHDTEQRYRYFRPYDNVSVLEEPMFVSKRSDIQKIMRQLRTLDIFKELNKQRPDTKWRLVLVTNVRFKTYSTNFPLGSDKIKLPKHIKDSMSIISLDRDPVTNNVYKDNFCLFRCLCLHLYGLTEKRKVDQLYETWRTFETDEGKRVVGSDPSSFEGMQLIDLPWFEQCFKVNVNVFELEENGNAYPIVKSAERFQNTMYVNHFENHLSYIQNFQTYARKFQCNLCSRLFDTHFHLKQHGNRCEEKTKFVFPGGFYEQPKTIFEKLDNIGIKVPNEDRYYPWFAVFDCESVLKKLENDKTEKVEWTHEHVPVSVSICSNVPGHSEAICYVQSDLQMLVDDMMSGLESIMYECNELAEEKWGWVLEAINAKATEVKKRAVHDDDGDDDDGDDDDGDDDDEGDRPHDDTITEEKLMRLHAAMQNYMGSLVILGFNSSKYDINIIKQKLLARLDLHLANKQQFGTYTIKKGNAYACISTPKFVFLDISHFLAPGTSYADFLKAYQISEEKGFFPYEWFDDFEKLKQTYLPEKEAFYSSLKNASISDEDYHYCQQIWQRLNMQTFQDFLIWYNNLDVKPFVAAATKLQQFYFQKEIDVFKTTISVPGIARKLLFNTARRHGAEFALMDKRNKDLHDKIKANICGGVSQIFTRFHKSGVTQLRGDKTCQKIIGFDANALYLWAIGQDMPEGLFVRRCAEKDFQPVYRDQQMKAYHWLNYLNRFHNKNIQHARNSEKEFRIGAFPVDGFDNQEKCVYQFHGCYFHGHNCVLTQNCTSKRFWETRQEKYRKTLDTTSFIKSKGYTVIEMWECHF